MSKENSRFLHSVGVFLLLRKFGASLEEQIAGLIHDTSHSVFSHTIDYINENLDRKKDHRIQDDNHEEFVKDSSVVEISKEYGIDL
ncbi:MAG: HD domain-containing protein [Candidatus Peribacteria bacterium]|jgi:HD superfamily phosphohydrolase|nr:HD domain-containing protein [Candidatus Peribacteria bacterium]